MLDYDLHIPFSSRCGHEKHSTDSSALQLISVISLLSMDTPSTDSPANIDAAKQVRDDIKGYRKKVSAAPFHRRIA
jgi:ubiquitin-protein ligase